MEGNDSEFGAALCTSVGARTIGSLARSGPLLGTNDGSIGGTTSHAKMNNHRACLVGGRHGSHRQAAATMSTSGITASAFRQSASIRNEVQDPISVAPLSRPCPYHGGDRSRVRAVVSRVQSIYQILECVNLIRRKALGLDQLQDQWPRRTVVELFDQCL